MTAIPTSNQSPSETGQILITSPEGVPLRFELASVVERFFALGVDLFLQALVIVLVALGLGVAGCALGSEILIALLLVGVFFLRHGYFTYFEIHWHGATPGKRVLALRVISRDGSGLTVPAVLARNIMRDPELMLPIAAFALPGTLFGRAPWWLWIPALAWIAIFAMLPVITRERTRAGDLVAGTVVVRVPRGQLLRDVAARVSIEPITFTPEQLSIYGEHELETLAEVIRQAERGKADQYDLRIIATTIARKIGYTSPEPWQTPDAFLRSFYKRQRAALEKRLLFGKRKASKFDR